MEAWYSFCVRIWPLITVTYVSSESGITSAAGRSERLARSMTSTSERRNDSRARRHSMLYSEPNTRLVCNTPHTKFTITQIYCDFLHVAYLHSDFISVVTKYE